MIVLMPQHNLRQERYPFYYQLNEIICNQEPVESIQYFDGKKAHETKHTDILKTQSGKSKRERGEEKGNNKISNKIITAR